MTGIPTITLWQPWASLVAAGAKPWEFRSWAAPARVVGARIGIHAGARPAKVTEIRALLVKLHSARCAETGLRRELAISLLERWKAAPQELPRSSVLCLATLGQPVRNADLAERLGAALCDGFGGVNDNDPPKHSNYGWPLTDIAPLRPFVPARGAMGFWTWRDEAAA